jgi:hypothetical protein
MINKKSRYESIYQYLFKKYCCHPGEPALITDKLFEPSNHITTKPNSKKFKEGEDLLDF